MARIGRERSLCGAVLDLDSIIHPTGISLESWLVCFPSYGFLLSIQPDNLGKVKQKFSEKNIFCTSIGKIINDSQLRC